MIREIEFRGRAIFNDNIVSDKLVYGNLFIYSDKYYYIRTNYIKIRVYINSISQYTNWKDIKGNKIYENDKVRLKDFYGEEKELIVRWTVFGFELFYLDGASFEQSIEGFEKYNENDENCITLNLEVIKECET